MVSSWLGKRSSLRSLPEGFLKETRALLLSRLRLGIYLALAVNLSYLPLDPLRFPDGYVAAIALRIGCAALLLALVPFTTAERFERHAVALACFGLVVLSVLIAGMIPLCRGPMDPAYVIQVMGVLFLLMGTALLLPIDGTTMFVFGLIPFALQIATTIHYPLLENLPMLFGTLVAVVIAAFGTENVFLARLGEYEGRVAKERLLETRSDLVAMLIHDIKNPLGVIDGYVGMLRDEPGVSAQAREFLVGIQGAVRRALMLAVNFLDVSRIEAHRLELRRKPTDVAQVLRHVLSHQRCLAELRSIEIRDESAAGLPLADVDEAAVDRVVANLVNNAIKHTPPGGTVRLGAHPIAEGDGIEIVVEDTGPGIPPGQEKPIFDRYTQASTYADSVGLGLFIARTITEAHGGKIAVENRPEGGARFRVTLPLRA